MTLRNILILLLAISLLGITYIFIQKAAIHLSDPGGSQKVCNPEEETKMPQTFN